MDSLKICVVGPPCTGKTLFSMLFAGQVPYSETYQQTSGLRVQVGTFPGGRPGLKSNVGPDGRPHGATGAVSRPNRAPFQRDSALVAAQETEKNIGGRVVRVQLWDCAGGAQNQAFWDVLARNIDGIMLFRSATDVSHEGVLEKLYISFAQPAKLSISQCLSVCVRLDPDTPTVEMERKLSRLPRADLDFSDPGGCEASLKRALPAIESMLASCLQKKEKRLAGLK